MLIRSLAGLVLAGVVLTFPAGAAQALTFTCSTIVTRGTPDPMGGAFKSKFEEPRINGSGDVLFVSKPQGPPKRLYLYPGAGTPSVIATAGDLAPGGSEFSKFTDTSINDAGDLAFRGDLVTGEGVFVKPSAGSLTAAVRTTDAVPGGGFFGVFPMVADISASGKVAFLATVEGGASGAYLYSGTVSKIAVVGDSSGDGRQFCDFSSVDLGDSGNAVLHTTTQVDCNDTMETPRDGVYVQNGSSFVSVAQIGDATPIGGTTYASFLGIPEINASDLVGFRARTAGTENVTGLFDFNQTGPTTTLLTATGDSVPGSTGFLKTIAFSHLTDGGRQAFRGRLRSGTARFGIFIAGGTPDAVALNTSPVPTDSFGAGAVYRTIEEDFGVDRSGTRVTFSAKVHDTVVPKSKIGLFRCTGS
ncbi:MAG TPA: choice-of-anchor tandem repeat NxxGxxAF-containing protein [Candidatus Binatia bacterium]|jgi:hypothetical protein